MLAICLGGAALLAYVLESSPGLARLLQVTHPLVAICVVLLGLARLAASAVGRWVRLAGLGAALVAAGCALVGLLAPLLAAILDPAMPMQQMLSRALQSSLSLAISPGTALTLLAIAMSQLLGEWRHTASRAFGGAALALGIAGLGGHLDGLPADNVSAWPTLIAELGLAAAAVLQAPREGFVAALLARSSAGTRSRLLLGGFTCALLLAGSALCRLTSAPPDRILFAHAVGGMLASLWLVIALGALESDRSDRRHLRAENQLALISTIDAVTGLYNHDHTWGLAAALPPANQPTALLFVDLDHFRSVNAVFGPAFGDNLLVEVGRRLQTLAGDHNVGRLRSDEFAILANNMKLPEAQQLGIAITQSIREPMVVAGRNLHLTASVGIAHSDLMGDTSLLEAATEAMYEAKCEHGNRSITFQQAMRDKRRSEFQLGQDLHEALDRDDQLSLVYQPVLRLSDQKLAAVEALARWMHPRLGAIPTTHFISLAEKTGLMPRLGAKLAGLAIAQLAAWRDRHPHSYPMVNLNVSALQFQAGDVVAELMALLNRYELSPSRFCIEVTESAFANTQAAGALTAARNFGFKVAMDDFGVGYSSLSQLPLLPLTSIKLDRSLIINADDSEDGAYILAAVIPLAHALRLDVVAEGVETNEQLTMVTDCNCDSVQGFLLARPVMAPEMERWLA